MVTALTTPSRDTKTAGEPLRDRAWRGKRSHAMETFIALLKVLRKSGIDPIATGMRTTPGGPYDREITISFRPDDQDYIDDIYDELDRMGMHPRRSQDGLTLAAGISDPPGAHTRLPSIHASSSD
jgi:hypothetical protein